MLVKKCAKDRIRNTRHQRSRCSIWLPFLSYIRKSVLIGDKDFLFTPNGCKQGYELKMALLTQRRVNKSVIRLRDISLPRNLLSTLKWTVAYFLYRRYLMHDFVISDPVSMSAQYAYLKSCSVYLFLSDDLSHANIYFHPWLILMEKFWEGLQAAFPIVCFSTFRINLLKISAML